MATTTSTHYFSTTTSSTDGWGEKVHRMECGCGWRSVALRELDRVERAFAVHVEGVLLDGGTYLSPAA